MATLELSDHDKKPYVKVMALVDSLIKQAATEGPDF